jgi:Ca2+-binding EF-hand superfamily protein
MVETEEKKEPEVQKNASERINLQHIMELREAFESADKDGGNDLDEDEFIEHFGDVIGKGMNAKQLRSLFMKIDADAGGTVDWTEFMNYMLLENQTLSMMKNEISYYVKSERPDP